MPQSRTINNELVLVKMGPRGNLNLERSCLYTAWDEPCYGRVKQILISYSAYSINSIQMVYELNGEEVLGERHGGDGDFFESIRFGTGHYITSISGHYGYVNRDDPMTICSLKFSTASYLHGRGPTTASYGPFGRETGTLFRFDTKGIDSLRGFHGTSSSTHLSSIGVYFALPNVKHLSQSGEQPALRSIAGMTMVALPPP
ncbi:hypothetical protein ZIOFF_065075 [Zingiber officinale]|uniref:Jacalin-type lectin domain-containing protein n=1 Tax=Zingiber officinale TaxID=94328 RepID=A0A8J5K8Q5_ZINOF|nr:hypothetical protein ZIOFF_065075 [Zingiber officinale]